MNAKEKNRREFPYAAEIMDALRAEFGENVKLLAARNEQGATIGNVPKEWGGERTKTGAVN